jgi:hypothetical protein
MSSRSTSGRARTHCSRAGPGLGQGQMTRIFRTLHVFLLKVVYTI